MSDTALLQLAGGVAVNLTRIDGRQWTAFPGEGKRGFGVDIRTADGEIVNFQQAKAVPPRVYIEGCDPLTVRPTGKSITVASSRGRDAIAGEIARRLLPGYREALAERREKEARARAEFAARAAAVNAAEALFGEPSDFGEYEPARRGEVTYKTGARLTLRGMHVVRPDHVTEYARVSVSGDASRMSLELSSVPTAVVMGMLAVLADYNAVQPGDDAEPKPFSAEFERLYGEYVAGGAKGPWTDWLKSRSV